MSRWIEDAIFYHIYPLGYCGAPTRNEGGATVNRLSSIEARLDQLGRLGANALYLGPVFESVAHGYDTVDYRCVDRRLGANEDLARLSRGIKARGMHLVLDGVFNHVGLGHPWFQSLREFQSVSPCAAYFKGLDFSRPSPSGSPFSYEGWNGCYDLARLELDNPDVREALISAALSWIEDYDIDGIRLDAADCVSLDFQRELSARCRARKPDFFLLGEIVHGDYRRWACPGLLDSVTNYECWKGLWSSLKDSNYFEIAYALKRQFGEGGIYRGIPLYNFADNHDVDRAASLLPRRELLYPLYCLLFTMPGIPSIYYGSELGATGVKSGNSDAGLRPSMEAVEAAAGEEGRDLSRAIARLASLRSSLPALRSSGYRELAVSQTGLAFLRGDEKGYAIVALNSSDSPVELELPLPFGGSRFRDELEAQARPGGESFEARGGKLRLLVYPHWARVLKPEA